MGYKGRGGEGGGKERGASVPNLQTNLAIGTNNHQGTIRMLGAWGLGSGGVRVGG